MALRRSASSIYIRSFCLWSGAIESTRDGLRFKVPKPGKVRIVELPASAIAALRAHRREAWHNDDLVFPGVSGGPQNPSVFSRALRRLGARIGLGLIGPHTLRHTLATMMLEAGIHPKIVADRLGHSTTRMTLDIKGWADLLDVAEGRIG
jgi:integrase